MKTGQGEEGEGDSSPQGSKAWEARLWASHQGPAGMPQQMRQEAGEAAKDLKSGEGSGPVTATATDGIMALLPQHCGYLHMLPFPPHCKSKINVTPATYYSLVNSLGPGGI